MKAMTMKAMEGRARAVWRATLVMAVAFLLACACAPAAFAAGPVDAVIPVEQTFSSEIPTATGTFNYELTALDTGAPMPTGAKGDTYAFSLTKTDATDLTISCDTVGDYHYTIKQVASGAGHVLDTNVYTVVVHVLDLGKR